MLLIKRHKRHALFSSLFLLPPVPSSPLLSSPLNGLCCNRRQGFYMVGAIVLQLATGFARVRALEAKSNNFSVFHRVRVCCVADVSWQ